MTRIDVLIKMGENEKAQEAIDELIEERRYMANASPRDLKLKRDYANILQRGGKINVNLGDYEKAIEYYTLAHDVFVELIEKEPENGPENGTESWTCFPTKKMCL